MHISYPKKGFNGRLFGALVVCMRLSTDHTFSGTWCIPWHVIQTHDIQWHGIQKSGIHSSGIQQCGILSGYPVMWYRSNYSQVKQTKAINFPSFIIWLKAITSCLCFILMAYYAVRSRSYFLVLMSNLPFLRYSLFPSKLCNLQKFQL